MLRARIFFNFTVQCFEKLEENERKTEIWEEIKQEFSKMNNTKSKMA